MTTIQKYLTTIDPGAGALAFAMTFVGEEMTLAHVEPLVKSLVAGEAHIPTNKKIKRCAYCNYYFLDPTRNNIAVVCSAECRKLRKALNERNKYVPAPPKPRPMGLDLEYPFYKDPSTMHRYSRKEVLKSPHSIANIQAARIRYEKMGGRKRKQEIIQYNGDELERRGFNVKITPHRREKGKVETLKMTREEYYGDKYSPERLAQERWRAADHEHKKFQYEF